MTELLSEKIANDTGTKRNALLDRFEKQNKAFEEGAKHIYKQIKLNRSWVKGRPLTNEISFESAGSKDDDAQQIQTNLIFSTVQGLVPHYFAKNPEMTAKPSRKVVLIDGDDTEEPQYDQAKIMGETIEIVTHDSVKKAGLKKKAKKWVRSALVSRLGVLKVAYQSVTRENEPVLQNKLHTAQDGLLRAAEILDGLKEEGEGSEAEAEKLRFDALIETIQDEMSEVVKEGVIIDVVPIENLRWDSSVSADEMRDAAWISQFSAITIEDAKIMADIQEGDDDEHETNKRYKSWSLYKRDSSKRALDHQTEEYVLAGEGGDQDTQQYVRAWERWDKATNSRFTWIEGDDQFIDEPVSMRYLGEHLFPYFALGLYWLDGEMWPTSMVEMITPLQIEYDDVRKQQKEHRKGALGFIMYDSSMVDGKDLQVSVSSAGVRDIVGVNANGQALSNVFFPGPTVQLNPAMYDTTQIQFDLGVVSGLQDADRGAITAAKTATEANILEGGKANRTAEAIDEIEDGLTNIYSYSAALCIMNMSREKVIEIAGENAIWPDTEEAKQEIVNSYVVKIKAGSTGRPDKRSEVDNWFGNLEVLMSLIAQVENKRELGVNDEDNPYYRIIEKTLKVLDQAEDVTTIMPKQKETLIDRLLAELSQIGPQFGVSEEMLLQVPTIAEYLQRKQAASQPQ